jgi:hypothetical protein
MTEELEKVADEYLDRFIASELVMVKIKDENYPDNSLKRVLLLRIRKRGLTKITAYTFLNELFLEKI